MDLQIQIHQQQELDQAIRRLADLQEQVNFKPIVEKQTVVPKGEPVPTGESTAPADRPGRALEDDEYLSTQADQLNRKMAELSNKLHLVPPTINCPELVKSTFELKAEIETVFSQAYKALTE
jgi:hypothetical protein